MPDGLGPMHKSSSIKTWFDTFGVEEFQWAAQSPDLHPTGYVWVNWNINCEPAKADYSLKISPVPRYFSNGHD